METKINKIAGYRAMLEMNQKDVAEYLNISPQSYSNKERGTRSFSDEEKVMLKELFKKANPVLTIDDIFF